MWCDASVRDHQRPVTSENVIRVRSNPKTARLIRAQNRITLIMMLVRMLMMMVLTHQYFDPRSDPTHIQKNHHQSDTTARTFRDGPVLSTPTKPTNAASLVHPRVKLLGVLLACALRVVRVFTGHAVARSRRANSLIMESRTPCRLDVLQE